MSSPRERGDEDTRRTPGRQPEPCVRGSPATRGRMQASHIRARRPMASFDDLRLETARLVLRPPRLEDLDGWSDMMRDEPTARFIGGVAERPVCWRQLMMMIGAWHAHGFAMFSVVEKASG